MSIQVNINKEWRQGDNAFAKGNAFKSNGTKLNKHDLYYEFNSVGSIDVFIRRMKDLSGFFSAVSKRNGVMAGVDHVRSIPLFYALNGKDFYLSDDAHWIWEQLGNPELDPYSCAEFLLTGYVTDSRTLVKGINQLQAGEALSYDSNKGKLTTVRYYTFNHNPVKCSKQELIRKLDSAIDSTINRLFRFAKGYKIVFPLENSFESILLAMQLNEKHYVNVSSFNYGRMIGMYSPLAKAVTERTGILHLYEIYNDRMWNNWRSYNKYPDFLKSADGLCTLPVDCEAPALYGLNRAIKIPADSVIVPVHSADFLAGGGIPTELASIKDINKEKLVNIILNRYYNINNIDEVAEAVDLSPDKIKTEMRHRIFRTLYDHKIETPEQAINACEYWEWQERQSKQMVNSVRQYEVFNYDWWIPWFDREFMDFWKTVPAHYRVNSLLYKDYIKDYQSKFRYDLPNPDTVSLFQKIKAGVSEFVNWSKDSGKPKTGDGEYLSSNCVFEYLENLKLKEAIC